MHSKRHSFFLCRQMAVASYQARSARVVCMAQEWFRCATAYFPLHFTEYEQWSLSSSAGKRIMFEVSEQRANGYRFIARLHALTPQIFRRFGPKFPRNRVISKWTRLVTSPLNGRLFGWSRRFNVSRQLRLSRRDKVRVIYTSCLGILSVDWHRAAHACPSHFASTEMWQEI